MTNIDKAYNVMMSNLDMINDKERFLRLHKHSTKLNMIKDYETLIFLSKQDQDAFMDDLEGMWDGSWDIYCREDNLPKTDVNEFMKEVLG